MTDDEILRPYLPWLRTVAGNLLGFDSPGIQDLMQEGYIEMWKALKRYDAKAGPLDYWLKFKASNRMKTIAIRAHDHPEREPAYLDEPVYSDPAATVSLGDLIEDLGASELLDKIDIAYHHGEIAAAIDRLSPQQKRYVIARFWLGLTGNEMIQLGVFGYDPSALWNSPRNGARLKLRQELAHLASR